MKARSTTRLGAGEAHRSIAYAPSRTPLQREGRTGMPGAATSQLQQQAWADNSRQAVQLKARAELMASRNTSRTTQRIADDDLLQKNPSVVQRKALVVQRALKPMEAEYWARDADDACEYVTPDEEAKVSLIARAQERPVTEWPLLAFHEDHKGAIFFEEDDDNEGIEMVEPEWQTLDPAAPANGAFIYVYAPSGQILLADRDTANHSEALAGNAVLGAGEITLAGNAVLAINRESGHYKPDPAMLGETRARLVALGLHVPAAAPVPEVVEPADDAPEAYAPEAEQI